MRPYMEGGTMNITLLHDLDTGFFASTMKPAFQQLGHTCNVLQTLHTYLDPQGLHVDHLLSQMDEQMYADIQQIFKETDLFLLRSVSDTTLRLTGVLPHITPHNTIWRIHGSELRENNVPYRLRTWRIDWHNREPLVVAPRDPSLFHLYRKNTITHIERPCPFHTFPRRNKQHPPFAITTPTNIQRKGTQALIDSWTSKIPLHIAHGCTRAHTLSEKAKASFYIDNVGSYDHGPYGMNTVEAWHYNIPAFSTISPMSLALVPALEKFITHSTIHTIQHNIETYTYDRSSLRRAYSYAHTTHDPHTIAIQYISLLHSL